MSDMIEMVERRQRSTPSTWEALLQELPARVVLDRLTVSAVGVSVDGGLDYVNPACAVMLGYSEVAAVVCQPLSELLAGHAGRSPKECLATLRAAGGTIVEWLHEEGYVVRTLVSGPLLLRATDPLLVFTITDVTDVSWADGPRPHSTAAGR